ncbi:MAG TPA: DUF5996 family protein [Desulfobacterales bacterium]
MKRQDLQVLRACKGSSGLTDRSIIAATTKIQEKLGFLLPYEAVRTADDPDAALLEFLQSTYEAAANNAGWNRDALERQADPKTRMQ